MIIDPKDFRLLVQQMIDVGYLPIFGEFNEQLEEIVVEAIIRAKTKGVKNLTLLINSNGGFTNVFASIKAAMIESGITFKGIVMGKASSNGFNILQQCNERVAVRDAILMFHWGSFTLNNSQIAALFAGELWAIEQIKEVKITMAQQVSDRTGIPIDKLMQFALYERYFTATQALALNFIDKVIDDLPIQIRKTLENTSETV